MPGLPEARAHAIDTACVMMRDQHVKKWQGDERRLHVTTEAGATALRLRFSAEGIEAIGGRLPELGDGADFAAGSRLSHDELRLVNAFTRIPEGEIRQTILELVEKIASETDVSERLRLV